MKFSKSIRNLVMTSMLATITLAGIQSSTLANDDWTGSWNSSEGSIELGGTRGIYTQDNGRLFYTVSNKTLTGYWVEDGSGQRCNTAKDDSYYWGKMKLEFNYNFSSFVGNWGYCNDTPTKTWTGNR